MKNARNKTMTKKYFYLIILLFSCQVYMIATKEPFYVKFYKKLTEKPLHVQLYEELSKKSVNKKEVKRLIKKGADPNQIAKTIRCKYSTVDKTSLQKAIHSENVDTDTILLLIENFSTVDVESFVTKNVKLLFSYGPTRYTYHYSVFAILFSGKKTVDEKIKVINQLEKRGFDMLSVDYNGFNALHDACGLKHPNPNNHKIIKKLIQLGVNVNQIDKNGDKPIDRFNEFVKRYNYDQEYIKNMTSALQQNKQILKIENNKEQTPFDSIQLPI